MQAEIVDGRALVGGRATTGPINAFRGWGRRRRGGGQVLLIGPFPPAIFFRGVYEKSGTAPTGVRGTLSGA